MLCPFCNKSLKNGYGRDLEIIDFQVKELWIQFRTFEFGKKIEFQDGNLTFIAKEGNDTWRGITTCYNCKKAVGADIIIKDGIIKEITNLGQWRL